MYQNQIIECFVDIASKFLMFVLMNLILMNTCLHITYILNIKVSEFILTIYYILMNYLLTTFCINIYYFNYLSKNYYRNWNYSRLIFANKHYSSSNLTTNDENT